MADSAHETALKAALALLQTVAGPKVTRNEVETTRVPPEGWVNLRDGEIVDEEEYLSPPSFAYTRRADVVVQVTAGTAAGRDAALDAILVDLDAAVAADPTLGGAVDMAWLEPAEPITENVEGGPAVKAAEVPLYMDYTATSPLG